MLRLRRTAMTRPHADAGWLGRRDCPSTLFLIRRGEVNTPSVTEGILESITRDTMIQLLSGAW